MWFSNIPGKSQITNQFFINTKDPLYSSDNVKQHKMVQKCAIYTLLLHSNCRVMMCGMWLEIKFLFYLLRPSYIRSRNVVIYVSVFQKCAGNVQTNSVFIPPFPSSAQDKGTENHVHTLSFSILDCFLLSHKQKNRSSHSCRPGQPSHRIDHGFHCWKYTSKCTDTKKNPEVRVDSKWLFYSIC